MQWTALNCNALKLTATKETTHHHTVLYCRQEGTLLLGRDYVTHAQIVPTRDASMHCITLHKNAFHLNTTTKAGVHHNTRTCIFPIQNFVFHLILTYAISLQ